MVFRSPYTTSVQEESTEKHFCTLKRRYGEKRLREAAIRRAHLNYQRIHIGDGAGSGKVKSLLAQMHQTYYFGFSESACILSGTLLEQGLIFSLSSRLKEYGPFPHSGNGGKRWLSTRQDLLELELVDMLDLARAQGIIREGRTLLLAHQIRWIRNMVVHEQIPLFHARDGRLLEMTVIRNRKGRTRYAKILLDRTEVSDLTSERAEYRRGSERAEYRRGSERAEYRRGSERAGYRRGGGLAGAAAVTAYFCVSRARMVLRSLFSEPKTEAKANDESSGDLFPGAGP